MLVLVRAALSGCACWALHKFSDLGVRLNRLPTSRISYSKVIFTGHLLLYSNY